MTTGIQMSQNEHNESPLPGPADIDAVLAFLPIFETPGFKFAEERGGEKQADGSFTMPYYELSDDASRFVKTLYDHGFILKGFKWSDWQHEAERLVNEPAAIESADLETICKLFTTHVRKDRFCEGHLTGTYDCGCINRILGRLRLISLGNNRSIMRHSKYRSWLENHVLTWEGSRIEWPRLMRVMFDEEFETVIKQGTPYQGKNVFIDRDSKAEKYRHRPDGHREDLSVYELFRLVHEKQKGCIRVGSELVWLITLQVPNQGKVKGRRADLLGLRKDGSIVVFECKTKNNDYSPIASILEGLDYLSHLMIEDNLGRLATGFKKWREKKRNSEGPESAIHRDFESVEIVPESKPALFILAPEAYYLKRSEHQWQMLSDRAVNHKTGRFDLDFATTDYRSDDCPLVGLNMKGNGAK